MLTELQIAERTNYIGGSDVGTICGVNKWGNIIDLWREKSGLKEIEDISHKPAVKAGNYLEPVIIKWFGDVTGKVLLNNVATHYHKTYDFLAANVDAAVYRERAILEAKTSAYAHGWGEQGEFLIPDSYLCQVAHYASVMDLERAYIAVLIGGNDFRWYTYERDEKLEEVITRKCVEFWNCVKTGTPPEPRTNEEVISLYRKATSTDPLKANLYADGLIQDLRNIRDEISLREEAEKDIITSIKAHMKDHSSLLGLDGKVAITWNNRAGSTRFDAKKFEKEHPELYKQYLTVGQPTRTFVVK